MSERVARSSLWLLTAGSLLVLGTAALLSLSVWQLERREWKLALIGRVTQRVHATAGAAPGPGLWSHVNRADDEYRHVRITGRFLNDHETQVQALTELGSGFWVLTPLTTVEGYTVLVNRGFVPQERRDPATRAAGQIQSETQVTGLVRMTEPGGALLRSNQPQGEHWYSRDVAAIARVRHLGSIAPYFIDADASPLPGGLPAGGLTVTTFPNNHLVYAVTWLALAVLFAGGGLQLGREEWRLRRRIRSVR